jgi:hypothetical protein
MVEGRGRYKVKGARLRAQGQTQGIELDIFLIKIRNPQSQIRNRMNPKSEFKNTCFERIEKWVEASFDNISQLFRGPPKLAYWRYI